MPRSAPCNTCKYTSTALEEHLNSRVPCRPLTTLHSREKQPLQHRDQAYHKVERSII